MEDGLIVDFCSKNDNHGNSFDDDGSEQDALCDPGDSHMILRANYLNGTRGFGIRRNMEGRFTTFKKGA